MNVEKRLSDLHSEQLEFIRQIDAGNESSRNREIINKVKSRTRTKDRFLQKLK